jgi:tetratricopeptide (TPR) repeat protein
MLARFYLAVGLYLIGSRFDLPQAIQFFQRALKLAKMCPSSSHRCDVLIHIARLQFKTGQYCTAQVHASEAQRLSQISGNLYDEARALWIEAECLSALGNFKKSADQLHRSRVMLGICGLSNTGGKDRGI